METVAGSESAYCSEDECCDNSRTTCIDRFLLSPLIRREIEVDVAIIGNGPSAIFLSLLLSGYSPYFTGDHPNTILKRKLSEHPEKSLLEQNLQYLSEGLEGRSRNPVSLLFDSLFHPNADTDSQLPSSLRWERKEDGGTSHIVLGCGKPGGVWHRMEQSLLTLSLGEWLDLPVYSLQDWKEDRNSSSKTQEDEPRAFASEVAQYYSHYVEKMGLKENFIDKAYVNRVTETSLLMSPVKAASPVGISFDAPFQHGAKCTCDTGVSCPSIVGGTSWNVRARQCSSDDCNEEILVKAKKLVLACGLTRPKRLNVAGEEQPFVVHKLCQLQTSLHKSPTNGSVMVIGAGMSAADAILLAINNGSKVYHAFYQNLEDNFIFNKLPKGMYHEYHRVWNLMQGKEIQPNYVPLVGHEVVSFAADGKCTLTYKGGITTIDVGLVAVMIGSQANLDFLPQDIQLSVALDDHQPIDSKHNSLDVDFFTSRSERYPNLYGLGPLTGDNFVRFLFGSGLACAKSILYSN